MLNLKLATHAPTEPTKERQVKKTVARRSFRGLSIEERKHERKTLIHNAALELYGTKGFFAVKVKDVCAEAGLTERYFYESFTNAESLFKAVYEALADKLRRKIFSAILHAAPDAHNMVRAGLLAFFSEIQNDGRVARILFLDALHVSSVSGKSIAVEMSNFEKEVRQFISTIQPDFTLSTQGALLLTGVNGCATTMALYWVQSNFRASLDEVLQACMMLCEPLVKNGLSSESSFFVKKTSKDAD